MISGNSRFDKYYFQDDNTALTKEEIKGMELFYSNRANCSSCHSDFNFTDYSFKNNGLYMVYEDPGRFKLTNNEEDRAVFKVPSLRNADLTAPYMHDGSIASLEEVVAHYNSGGKDHPHKSDLIRPLNLTPEEQTALLAFLKSLTDTDFINNKKYRP
jgi:cytochrome c peroxidase